MKNVSKFLILGLLVIFTFSCASSYQVIKPDSQNYVSKDERDAVVFEYKYNQLKRKYQKKMDKKGIKIASVKISNNSESDIKFGEDIQITDSNNNPIVYIDSDNTLTQIKQQSPLYLLYLLLTPLNLYTYKTNEYGMQETSSSIPIGYVLGPGLAVGNLAVAASSNKKLKSDLTTNNLHNRLIKKGETVYGIISIQSHEYKSLKIRTNN